MNPFNRAERKLLADLRERVSLIESRLDRLGDRLDQSEIIALLREIRKQGKATEERLELLMTVKQDIQALIGQFNDRTNEIREDLLSVNTTVGAMRVDLVEVRDRIQRLVDGQGDLESVKAELQSLLNNNVAPAVAEAESIARDVEPIAADLDLLGKDPANPVPTPSEPVEPPAEEPPA
jgi:chromosome segregation ATPase